MKIKLWFKWIFYWFLTQNERVEFAEAKYRGYDVFDSDSSGTILPGDSIRFSYNKNRKPKRRYLTRKEFFERQNKI